MSEQKEDDEMSENQLNLKRKGSIMSPLKEDTDLPRTRTRLATGLKRKSSTHQDKTRLRSGAQITAAPVQLQPVRRIQKTVA
jgi:uncharacterized protein (UPF0147 family)